MNDNIQHHIDNISAILSSAPVVEGNLYCIGSADNRYMAGKPKIINLQKFCIGKNNICEIGFNAGHSALFMLNVNSTANYTFFDICRHEYTKPCFEYIQEAFPDANMEMIDGDSKKTLKHFNSIEHKKFDLIHIDGGHDEVTLANDVKYSLQMLDQAGVLIIDDSHLPRIKSFCDEKLPRDHLTEIVIDNTKCHRVFIKNE